MLRRLRRLPGHLRPRQLRIYGVGNGKSGTTSLAQVFGGYRAGHEVDRDRLTALAIPALTGAIAPDSARARAELRRRSRRFHLDVDVANMLSPFAGTLASLYPDAQFILMIRDCFSWLDSRIERNIADAAYVNSALYAARYGRRDDAFASEESPLRVAGLRPIASYLRAWADVNDGVLGNVPRDRLLVVRTEDLDASRAVLAEFVGVPQSSLRAVHANHRASRGGLLAEVPVSFVLARAEEHCRELMEQFWGADWRQLTDRLPATGTTR